METTEQEYIPYSQRPDWADVTPIAQDDGPGPIAPIAYTEDYKDAMGYFRAISRAKEISLRALQLTEEIFWLNPGHYTAWAYRLEILKEMNVDLYSELEFLDEFAEYNPKTYQLWHHRREIITLLGEPLKELDFVAAILADDAKNFHAWAYRQWVIRHFNLWDDELTFVEKLISEDVRNNSVWNQRYFVVTRGSTVTLDSAALNVELDYCFQQIAQAPSNECPWVYMKGLLHKFGSPQDWVAVEKRIHALIAEEPESADEGSTKYRPSRHTWGTLVEIQAAKLRCAVEVAKLVQETPEAVTSKCKQEVQAMCEMLGKELDPIRQKYWQFRTHQLVGM
ncbi:CAAX geranylgeranyltransferase alpha subunit [Dimargaris xerosporica]|nr:CAAX geranylgeranyltransferase alpha subunit [Dimargaris xerosporica]